MCWDTHTHIREVRQLSGHDTIARMPPGVEHRLRLGQGSVERLLELARQRLNMDLAYITHFSSTHQVVESVSGSWVGAGLTAGTTVPIEDTYCARVLSGEMDPLIPDTLANQLTAAIPATAEIGIGAYATTVLRASDGSVYGTLCCIDHDPRPDMRQRDLDVLALLGDLLAEAIDAEVSAARRESHARRLVQAVIDGGGPSMVFQPVVRLADGHVVAYEALSRFPDDFPGPAEWFAEAGRCGMGIELELSAARQALRLFDSLDTNFAVAINLSAQALCDDRLLDVLRGAPLARVILEITEHDAISNYVALRDRMRLLRAQHARFAVDDTGSAYAGMRQIVELAPDIIKMDYHITHDIDRDPTRMALATALMAFARATGAELLAEGIETAAELRTAAALGIDLAQGYHLGRPVAIPLREARWN